jgi:hypothetical protein
VKGDWEPPVGEQLEGGIREQEATVEAPVELAAESRPQPREVRPVEREKGHDLLADEQVIACARGRIHPDHLAVAEHLLAELHNLGGKGV